MSYLERTIDKELLLWSKEKKRKRFHAKYV